MILVAALALRAWAHTAAAFGVAESLSYQNLYIVTIESQWGRGWQWQMAAALALAVVSLTISRWPSAGWRAAGVAAIALCYLLPLLGHAAGEPGRVLLHGSHILAAGIWIGTLAAMADRFTGSRSHATRRAAADSASTTRDAEPVLAGRPDRRDAAPGSPVRPPRGSTWAGGRRCGRPATDSCCSVKLLLAAGVAGCGFVNWQALRQPDLSMRVAVGRAAVGRSRTRARGQCRARDGGPDRNRASLTTARRCTAGRAACGPLLERSRSSVPHLRPRHREPKNPQNAVAASRVHSKRPFSAREEIQHSMNYSKLTAGTVACGAIARAGIRCGGPADGTESRRGRRQTGSGAALRSRSAVAQAAAQPLGARQPRRHQRRRSGSHLDSAARLANAGRQLQAARDESAVGDVLRVAASGARVRSGRQPAPALGRAERRRGRWLRMVRSGARHHRRLTRATSGSAAAPAATRTS